MLQLQRYSGCYVVQKLFKGCSKVVQRLLILNNIEREALNAEGFERAQRFELMERINGGEYETNARTSKILAMSN